MTTSSPAPHCPAKQNALVDGCNRLEGESQSRWSGSQNEVQTIIKEQIVNSAIMTPTPDTDNPEFTEIHVQFHDFGDGKPVTVFEHFSRIGGEQFGDTLVFAYQDLSDEDGPAILVTLDGAEDLTPFHEWLDQTNTGMHVKLNVIEPSCNTGTEGPSPSSAAGAGAILSLISEETAAMLRRVWTGLGIPADQIGRLLGPVPEVVDWTEMVDAHPVFDRAGTLRALEGVTDPDIARRICEQASPTFPLASCIFPDLEWAGEAGDPYWVSVDNLWQRYVSRTFADQDLQGVVEISGYQECREPGIATFTGLGLDVAVVDEDLSVEAARALRLAFSEIAEITAGPRSIFDMDGAQALAIANIVAILEATELEVETLARVATALGVRASDLLRPISTEEN